LTPGGLAESGGEWTRAWWAALSALALTYALFVGRGGPGPIPIALLTVALVAGGFAAVGAPRWPKKLLAPMRLVRFGIAGSIALLTIWPVTNPLAQERVADYAPFWLGLVLTAVVLVVPRFGAWLTPGMQFGLLILLHLAIGTWVILIADNPHIDVWIMQRDGVQALAEGINPYLPIYDNLHGVDSPYYGPGLVVDGKLTIGFPYPPLSLILAAPGELLLGDPRFAHLMALEASAVAMAFIRWTSIGRSAAVLLLFNPWTFFLIAGSWTEPLVILAVALVGLAAARAQRWLWLAVGMMISVKQYAIIGLPLAVLLLTQTREAGWRLTWRASALAIAMALPFAIWDPGAFGWSAIGSLAAQIFRPDSLSYLVLLPGDWGPRLSILGFLFLIPVSALIYWRAPRSPAGFATGMAFLLLAFFAFSRQGSANYHFAVIGCLLIAVAATEAPAIVRAERS
jgi:hypothetical protein